MEEQGQVQIIKAKKLAKEVADSGRKLRVAAYCRVSTTSDEQIDSFNSQMTYYKTLIESNPNWVNAGIYADEGITGTAAEKRPDFMRMITDAMQGRIDVILVKSLSRFARNTVDTLNYVRALKEKKVYVRFEEEHIDTATEQGELLITVLSSVAQQEVQNTSEHVKKGLSMMMSKGDLVGFNSCLGYNYDEKTKKITINEKEAEIIRYIFKRYLEGIGTTVLARELGQHGWKTKYGSAHWCDSTILGILKNEKYKGDLLQGKTFTVDPITKKRLDNRGESDKFYLTNHHEPIVSVDEWERANAMLQKRSYVRRLNPDGTRSRFSRTYPFSSLLECGFCGKPLSRRSWRSGKNYEKTIWQCMGYAKDGKHTCPNSKGIPEEEIGNAFVDAYNRVVGSDSTFLEDFIQKSEDYLRRSNLKTLFGQNERKLKDCQTRMDQIAGLLVDGQLSQEAYDRKFKEISIEKGKLQKEKEELDYKGDTEANAIKNLEAFRKAAVEHNGKKMDSFMPEIFDACVEKIIVGGKDDAGNPDPYMMTFVFKKGFGPTLQSEKGDLQGKSHTPILTFDHFWRHVTFVPMGDAERQKVQKDFIRIVVAVDFS
jgi:site-specific DNA recombinase